MKILMLNYEFPPIGGGAANANYYLLKEFSKKNIHIDLLTSSPGKYKEGKFSKNIRVFRLNVGKKDIHYWKASEALLYTTKALFFLKKLIKKHDYDLIHSFFALPTGIIPYLLNKPYIVSLRGSDVPGFNSRLSKLESMQKPIFNKICSKSRKVIANSIGLKQLAEKSFSGKIDIIENGIDTAEFSPSQKKEKQIICVSRLIERKGINYLIEAMPRIKREYRLVIIGDGPKKDELIRLAKSNNSFPRITFLDYIRHDKLPAYYKKSMMFALPSLNEGMSNTVLEAMSCGLPIITTDTGGTNELIRQNGLVIEKESSLSIANAVNNLIENDKLREELSRNSRELAKKKSWKITAAEYLKIYRDVKP